MKGASVWKIKTICVLCEVNPGKDGVYVMEANALGLEMVRRETDMVYGGGCLGLVGCVSYAVCL